MGGIRALRTRRSRVDALAGTRRQVASRAPACPPKAMPIARRTVMSRWVLQAYAVTSSGRRSVKIRRVQVAFRQANLRTVNWMRTVCVSYGRSVRWR
jgi:hypothetical protein